MKRELIGQQIVLIPTQEKDLDFISLVETNKALWIYEDYVKEDKEETKKLFRERMREDVNVYDFLIYRKSDIQKTPIGLAYIWSYNDYRKSFEIGYIVLPDFQSQGYAKESAKLLIKFGFQTLGAHKIVGMCNAENLPSAHIMRKIGMRKEGVFKEELYWNAQWTDQCFFSILDKEFYNIS